MSESYGFFHLGEIAFEFFSNLFKLVSREGADGAEVPEPIILGVAEQVGDLDIEHGGVALTSLFTTVAANFQASFHSFPLSSNIGDTRLNCSIFLDKEMRLREAALPDTPATFQI